MTPGPSGTEVPRSRAERDACAERDARSASAAFGELPPAARDALLARAVERRFARGATLFLAGAPATAVLIVLEGRVRVLRGGGGRPHVLHEEGPGGTLGEVPVFERADGRAATYPATAVAAEPTRVLAIAHDDVRRAARAEPTVALALLARMAARVRLLVDRVDERTTGHTLQRLAALVLARSAAAGSARVTLGRTQQEAAEELGTVRELVVRGLRALRSRGLVRPLGRGRYELLDRAGLRALAAGADAEPAAEGSDAKPTVPVAGPPPPTV